jgi:hypothetical protein
MSELKLRPPKKQCKAKMSGLKPAYRQAGPLLQLHDGTCRAIALLAEVSVAPHPPRRTAPLRRETYGRGEKLE